MRFSLGNRYATMSLENSDFVVASHVGASDMKLAPAFLQKTPKCAYSAAPPFPTKAEGRFCGGPILSAPQKAILPH